MLESTERSSENIVNNITQWWYSRSIIPRHSVGSYLAYVIMSRLRSIHFASTILPQDIRVCPNWHGIYECGL